MPMLIQKPGVYTGYQILTEVGKKNSILWDITMQSIDGQPAFYLLHDGFLLDLFFDPEDGGDMLL
jgi:hypothetical protein